MKIGNFEITFGAKNEIKETRSEGADLINRIKFEQQLYRIRQDIGKWRTAITAAESVFNPQRYQLYQVYIDVVLDAHLTACIQNRKNLTLGRKFKFVSKDGKVNEEATALLETKWFRDFVNLALDSQYWGYSLIQLGDVTDAGFASVELVPRINVKPEFHIVVDNYAAMTGTDYAEEPFKDWCVGVGDCKDLGLLMKAAPYVLWKRLSMGGWAEYSEIFGTPLRIAKTNVRDAETYNNAKNFMQNMGVATWGVFDKDDEVEFLETSRTDASKVYNDLVERCNSEISKLILGSTALLDEKSFVGSAEVQERVVNRYAELDEHFLENVVNLQLKPLMELHGFPVKELTFEISDSEQLTHADKAKFEIELLKTGKYSIDPQYIEKTYGIPVAGVEQPKQVNGIQNELNFLYP